VIKQGLPRQPADNRFLLWHGSRRLLVVLIGTPAGLCNSARFEMKAKD